MVEYLAIGKADGIIQARERVPMLRDPARQEFASQGVTNSLEFVVVQSA